jgi:TonB family protein
MLITLTACARSPKPMPRLPEGGCPGARPRDSQPNLPAIPIRRPDPTFPMRALSEGVQGWVCLRFTVTREGTVRDAEVVASAPEGYFEEAALDAARRYIYQPSQYEFRGVIVRLDFSVTRRSP